MRILSILYHLVPAGFFSAVNGTVHTDKQFRQRNFLLQHDTAEACRDLSHVRKRMGLYILPELLSYGTALHSIYVREKYHKFLTAPATYRGAIHLSYSRTHNICCRDESFISCGMTVGIIDVLEVVNIKHDKSRSSIGLMAFRNYLLYLAAVVECGKTVLIGYRLQLCVHHAEICIGVLKLCSDILPRA